MEDSYLTTKKMILTSQTSKFVTISFCEDHWPATPKSSECRGPYIEVKILGISFHLKFHPLQWRNMKDWINKQVPDVIIVSSNGD